MVIVLNIIYNKMEDEAEASSGRKRKVEVEWKRNVVKVSWVKELILTTEAEQYLLLLQDHNVGKLTILNWIKLYYDLGLDLIK